MKTRKISTAILLLMIAMTATAQCSFRNTAFKSGEFLHWFRPLR